MARPIRLALILSFTAVVAWLILTSPMSTGDDILAAGGDAGAPSPTDAGAVARTAEQDASRLQETLKSLQGTTHRWLQRLNHRSAKGHAVHGGADTSAEAAILAQAGPNFQLQYHFMHKQDRDESIFVGVTCFSSHRCTDTLKSLFAAAAKPRNIFVGLVEHRREKDTPSELALEGTCDHSKTETCWSDQMRSRRFEPGMYPGAAFARAAQETMYRNERFVMFVTAPLVFARNWDTQLIATWGAAAGTGKSPRTVVLSHGIPSVPASGVKDEVMEEPVPLTTLPCDVAFVADESAPVVKAKAVPAAVAARPSYFVDRSLFFMERLALAAVPMDGALREEPFAGDNFLLSARLWTSGFNVYQPANAVASAHTDIPVAVAARNATLQSLVKDLLERPAAPPASIRGLGKTRSFDQFLTAVGVDVKARTVSADTKRCEATHSSA